MCIRDRHTDRINNWDLVDTSARDIIGGYIFYHQELLPKLCLLYTSDAADERSSVDLGGRRIIKKKKIKQEHVARDYKQKKHTRKMQHKEDKQAQS